MRIRDVYSTLVSTYIDWNGFLANPRYVRAGNEISWSGRDGVFLPDLVRPDDVLRLVENRQYTFQTLDNGSVLQFYYNFDGSGNNVTSASLAYYGAPVTNSEEDGFDFGEQDENPDDALLNLEPAFVNWLRIDFSPATARGVLHHDCHLHLGGFPNSRLMVRRLPSPKQFVEFVIATCHPEQYKLHRLGPRGEYIDLERIRSINDEVFTCENKALYDYMIHIATPGR